MISTLVKYSEKISIFHIILTSFAIHMFVINQPTYEVLDEAYFTNFTRWFMLGIDHTPYQLFGLSLIEYPFVSTIGDNWFSWRFPVIVFGMVFLYFNYKVVEHLKNKKIALLTTGILCFSPLIFVHSSLLLRDIPVMALGFMSIYFYFKQKYYFSALLIGLSALIKESAIFFLIFIVLHYIMTNHKKIITQIQFKEKIPKTPFIAGIILASSFLIPIAIYDNTITVLEYTTRYPQILIDSESKPKIYWFDIKRTNSTLLTIPVSDFNYVSKVTNPIHHISLMFSNGYYNERDPEGEKRTFQASFLLAEDTNEVSEGSEEEQRTFFVDKVHEKHSKLFPTLWNQSAVNYSWWYIAFYCCIGLIVYSTYIKIKNKTELSKESKIMICGIVSFFIPYLLINEMRDVYIYYMIYYLPIMAIGLVTVIYKIPKPEIRLTIMIGFGIAILVNFVWMFPVQWF